MTDLIKETIAPIIALADHIILTVMERRGYPQGYTQGYKDAMRDRPKRRATNRLQNKRLQTMKFNIKPQIIIGIDPDVEASGLGIINTTSAAGLLVDYMTLPLPNLAEPWEEDSNIYYMIDKSDGGGVSTRSEDGSLTKVEPAEIFDCWHVSDSAGNGAEFPAASDVLNFFDRLATRTQIEAHVESF